MTKQQEQDQEESLKIVEARNPRPRVSAQAAARNEIEVDLDADDDLDCIQDCPELDEEKEEVEARRIPTATRRRISTDMRRSLERGEEAGIQPKIRLQVLPVDFNDVCIVSHSIA